MRRRKDFRYKLRRLKAFTVIFTTFFWGIVCFLLALPPWLGKTIATVAALVIVYNLALAVRHVWRTWEAIQNGTGQDSETR